MGTYLSLNTHCQCYRRDIQPPPASKKIKIQVLSSCGSLELGELSSVTAAGSALLNADPSTALVFTPELALVPSQVYFFFLPKHVLA